MEKVVVLLMERMNYVFLARFLHISLSHSSKLFSLAVKLIPSTRLNCVTNIRQLDTVLMDLDVNSSTNSRRLFTIFILFIY